MSQVSILIPVYNREKYIDETINSIYRSTFKDFEIIIYDDGSTDKTRDIIRKYNVKLLEGNVNRGIGFARQSLLNAFQTPYACWLDSDDIMHEDRLEKQLSFLKQNKLDICYTGIKNFSFNINNIVQTVDAEIERYTTDIKSFRANTTCATGMFTSKAKLIRFNSDLKCGEDVTWLYNMFMAEYRIGYLKEYLYYYRQENEDRLTIKRRKGLLGDINYGK